MVLNWPLLIALCALLTAGIAIANAVNARRRASEACATCARLSGIVSELEATKPLTPSSLAELAELREAVTRAEDLLVKVNRREIARSKSRDEAGQFARLNGHTSKDELRARAGLRAGLPAPHQ